jgi:hypothetical protein
MSWQTLASGYGGPPRVEAERLKKAITSLPRAVIEVACNKCEWKAEFNRAELMALHGQEYPLPDLLDHLAMPGCPKLKQFMPEPHPIGVENVALAVLGNLPDVTVTGSTFRLLRHPAYPADP